MSDKELKRTFLVSVTERLDSKKANEVLSDLEEVLKKHNLVLSYSYHELECKE